MQLASVVRDSTEYAAVVDPQRGVALVRDVVPDIDGDLRAILEAGVLGRIESALADAASLGASIFEDPSTVRFGAPYRHPRMIWGIGLNYVAHAQDLTESVPEEPASFMKADHTVIGPGEDIPIPSQSKRTTAEAELGLIIGRRCRNVEPDEALSYLAGFCPVLDQTAEDILEPNPRFLTRSKNFPGFFSFGPRIVPVDEVLAEVGSIADIEVTTAINGEVHRKNTVAHMRYDPAYLISFHSKVMPLEPGDIISPGTPGAVHIRPGDTAECWIPGVGNLANPVVAGP
jgi:2-keto-4-pentenoate hydratase/2-oxohepta-3-ene-1,7-dioic acid hydratase in catechol pathway